MKFSVRLLLAVIVAIFAALAVGSILSDNNLVPEQFGLDYFPDWPAPRGMGIVQGLAYMSLIGAVGLLWFRGFVVGAVDARSRQIALVFTIITILLHVVLIAFIRVWEQGGESVDIFNLDHWQVEARASSIRALLCIVIGLPIQQWFAYADASVAKNRWMMLMGGLIALGSLTVVGHTANLPPTWLTHGADFVHGLGASFWFGGLLGLVLYMRQAFRNREDALRAGEVLARFSRYALWSVVSLALSGTVMAIAVKDDPLETGSPFARTLMLKLLLVLIPVVLAAWNRYRLVPALETPSDTDDAWAMLRRTTLIEMAMLVVIVAVTGFLVLQRPTV